MNKKIEFERKFLINKEELRKISSLRPKKNYFIEQYYLEINPQFEKRVRMKHNLSNDKVKFILTQKKGIGAEREEQEKEITVKEYFSYINTSMFKNKLPIYKNRKVYTIHGYEVEIDNFIITKEDLTLCEVEFDSKKEMENFKPFNLMGKEVTFDKNYKNKNIFKKINELIDIN